MLESGQERGRCKVWPLEQQLKRSDINERIRYQDLSIEEALVFSYIESSGREGIWTKTIRSRTNLHLIVMNRCLKSLEHKVFIKPIQSAKFPKRKIYILAHLQPSDDVTGGPFYTDGTLDEEFVHQLGLWVEGYVLKRSWHHPTTKTLHRKKGKSKLPHEDVNQPGSREHRDAAAESAKAVLPMPPGFTGYPTIPQITQAINESGLSGVVMKESEIRQLVDVLCWDGRMMKAMGSKGYKAVRQAASDDREHVENALTEAPCGKCPVFDLCEESGPVNAKTCEYFQDWLAL